MFFPWEEQNDSQFDSANQNRSPSIMPNRKEEEGCDYLTNCHEDEVKSSKENSQENRTTAEYNDNDFFANNECPSLGSLSFGEIMEAPDTNQSGISAVLRYCKYKILRPYLRVLACIGLRPLKLDDVESSFCGNLFSILYTVIIIVLLLLGYILQYLSCFRRDRGFCYTHFGVQLLTSPASVPPVSIPAIYGDERPMVTPISSSYHHQICFGSEMFSYWIPSALHLSAYLYTLYLFRISNNEQLQSMMERVFLSSAGPYDGTISQRRLLRILWLFIGCSIVWIILSSIVAVLMLENGTVLFQWLPLSSQPLLMFLKIAMIICTLFHDTVQATIIISYCIQTQLLKSQSQFLKGKLIHQFLTPLEWMREVSEFRTQLNYLNNALSPAICLFTILNLSRAMSGAVWLLKIDSTDMENASIAISIVNMCLWLLITLAPFVQAARLTNSCITMQMVGHDIRTKPLAYNSTPDSELDSILLYASSLRLSAKLFNVPITGRCIYLTITILIIFLLTFGQSHYSQVT